MRAECQRYPIASSRGRVLHKCLIHYAVPISDQTSQIAYVEPQKMNILLIGSGGREHALAWKIAQSPKLGKLFIAPGNPGTASLGQNVSIKVADHASVLSFCHENKIELVVIGPEAPLVAGLADDLSAAGVAVFGPTKAAAQLEGSKGFTKDLCAENNIPTAAYQRFNNATKAKAYARSMKLPIVVKADGLAAGKGVTVATSFADAFDAIEGAEVVIEEFLEGTEASFFCLCDGKTALSFGTAQDHKRAFNNDEGPNTGGMGAFSPAANLTPALEAEIMARIIEPTLKAMAARGTPFSGVLFAGLMLTESGTQLIEYNARFGDPECQVLMTRLQSDIVPLLMAAANGTLEGHKAEWKRESAMTVVMAAKGYPGHFERGTLIKGVDAAEADGARVFHAGTQATKAGLVANGGRVLNVTASGIDLAAAHANTYRAVFKIDWRSGFCRTDIGKRWIKPGLPSNN
jgi:phosphoribosylamine---glycine ligase